MQQSQGSFTTARRHVLAVACASLCIGVHAQQAPSAPPFDVAYRAWDIVTGMAKQNRDPAIGGECARTFRPFVIPGLRQQSRQDQDIAATACVAAARSACGNKALRRDADTVKKCEEFRP